MDRTSFITTSSIVDIDVCQDYELGCTAGSVAMVGSGGFIGFFSKNDFSFSVHNATGNLNTIASTLQLSTSSQVVINALLLAFAMVLVALFSF